jgi:predicted nucleic acid-binding protein
MLEPFFKAVEDRNIFVVTSVMTLLEVLVHPIRDNDEQLIQRYQEVLFGSIGFTTVNVNRVIAEQAARLRASYNIRTPDSIQMATAIVYNAKYFLTNDLRLPSLAGLTVLKLDELKTQSNSIEQTDEQ